MRIFKKGIARLRLKFQVVFTLLSNGYIRGFVEGTIYQGRSKAVCLPGLNCYSCPGALGACPVGSMQAVLNSRQFSFSYYVLGYLIAFGAFFGRFICGFMCPFGLYQDLLYKIPIFRKRKEFKHEKHLRKLKYLVLLVFVVILPVSIRNFAGMGSPYYCKYICPSGTLMAGIPLVLSSAGLRAAIGRIFSWKIFLLVSITILSIKTYRPFCKYLCPLGGFYGVFNPIAIFRFEIDQEQCIDCGQCKRACKFNIDTKDQPNSRDCIRCGDCIEACPTDAIRTSLTRKKDEKVEIK